MSTQDEFEPPIDPRRALGRRPGAAPPRLQIDNEPFDLVPPSPTFNPPSSPRTRHVSLSTPSPAIEITSPTSPTSPNVRKFRRPTIHRNKQPQKVSLRGLYETQKLLSHLLDKLEIRESAPDLLDRAAISAREVSGKSARKPRKAVVKIGQTIAAAAHTGLSVAQGNAGQKHEPQQGIGSEDLEDQLLLEEGDWDTEATYDLVDQTRGLLVLAHKQGLDLFASDSEVGGTSISPQVRPAKRKTGRFSSFASPVSPQRSTFGNLQSPLHSASSTISGRTLLDRLLAVLTTLINVDCLHRTHQFRLLRPPIGLQAACLDIASYLYQNCNSGVKVQVLELVIGGIYTMGVGLLERICEWVEGRLGEMLGRLARERGGSDHTSDETAFQDPFAAPADPDVSIPTFALSTDTPEAQSPGWIRYSPSSPNQPFFPREEMVGILSIQSSTLKIAPLSLQLASLVPRLLHAISSSVDLSTAKLTTIHRVHRLVSLVLSAKPDSSLDLLEIIAHAPVQVRRSAVELLSTFYPESTGHNAISRRPALSTFQAQRSKWETGQEGVLGEDSTENHHFVPWRISSRDADASNGGKCGTCRSDIHGFGLRCTLCDDYRHLHCYSHSIPDQGFHYEVVTVAAKEVLPYVVNVKFSLSLSRLDEKVLHGASARGTVNSTRRRWGQHDLQLVNLFTTTLCHGCQLPLWGTHVQAYACMNGCQRFLHQECVDLQKQDRSECKYGRDVMVDEIAAEGRNPFTITLDMLKSSFHQHSGYLCLDEEALSRRSYDEVAILYGTLWVQYQLLKNGLASGSIRPTLFEGKKLESDILQLRPYLKAYEEFLRMNDTHASSAATDFGHVANQGQVLGQGYLYSERFLAYITALIRSPSMPHGNDSPGLSEGHLTASGILAPHHSHEKPVDKHEAYEVLDIASIARSLRQDLNITDPRILVIFLEQLRKTGLITVPAVSTITLKDVTSGSRWCTFGLPLLMDSSPTVEVLILAIEVLLGDLDLMVNEVGMRLLSTRAWPSLLCSPYALERLGGALVKWVVAEDETLHEIVKQFASKHKRLPGVRSGTKGSSSVQQYKEDRAALLERYARPWLIALHNQDPALYGHVVYEQCKSTDGVSLRRDGPAYEAASHIAASALERMTAMVDASLMFSVQLDLLTAWLEDLGSLASKDMIYRSLPRLLRNATVDGLQDEDRVQDIWAFSRMTITDGQEGVARVCKWFRVLSFSGVDVPWSILIPIIESMTDASDNLETILDLVITVNANAAWIDPSEFAKLCNKLFISFISGKGSHRLSGGEATGLLVIKQCMRLVLRAYGVSLDDIATTALGTPDMHTKQPASMSKRRRATTASLLLLPVGEELAQALAAVIPAQLYPTELFLDFMWMLFTKSTSAANIDGYLYRQCEILYPVLWNLVDDHAVDRKSRARVFLRLLAVNPTPVERIVKEQFRGDTRTHLRERLLLFVLELADETLTRDNLYWRRASVGLVVLFFEALLDHTDVGPDSLVIVQSMLPTQLTAISGCFEEYLVQSSDEQRLALMPRLHRLRLLRPVWPVLSWRVIEDLLVETSNGISHMRPARTSATVSALLDAVTVRANLIALGLDMLSAGIEIPWITAQQFQQHVGQTVALPWDHPLQPLTTLVLPALRTAVDSIHRIAIGPLAIEGKSKKTALVGALFVPIVIDFGRELHLHDFVVQRDILDILNVVFFKQNTRTVELAALGALQSIAEVVKEGQCAENRLLALQILHTAINRVERDSLVRAIPLIFGTTASVLVKETDEEGDSILIEQCRLFLRVAIKTFGRSKLFVQLFKNDSVHAASATDGDTLGRALRILRSTERPSADGTVRSSIVDLAVNDLPDVLKRGRQTVEQVLESFDRFAAEIEGEISEDASIAFGSFVNRLGKHIAEWDAHEFDPNPFLRACAAILALSPPGVSTMLLHQISTLLHLCLNRFAVITETVASLLHTSAMVSKAQTTEDTVRTVLFELAGSALHGLHVAPSTLDSLLRYINKQAFPDLSLAANGQVPIQQRRVLSDSAGGCMSILLRQHASIASTAIDSGLVLAILGQAGVTLCQAEIAISGTLSQHMGSTVSEAAIIQLRAFIPILLVSLDIPMLQARRRLVALYPILARAMSLCLRASADLLGVQDVAGDGAENLSTIFAVFRLALLAAHDPPTTSPSPVSLGTEEGVESLWSRIWPDWHRLLSISVEATCVNGPLRSISHTVFLDMIIFLGGMQSTLLVRHAGSINHALRTLHRNQGTTGHGVGKMIKAEAVIRDAGLAVGEVDRDGTKRTIKADLLAAERLRALRSVPS